MKKKLFSWIATLITVLVLLCAASSIASADNPEEVPYQTPEYKTADTPSSGVEKWNDTTLKLNGGQHIDVKSSTTTWNDNNKVYVVSGTVTIDDTVTVSGDVKLLLRDDSHLTVTKGIKVSGDNNKLTIFVESTKKNGKLTVTSPGGNYAAIGGVGDWGTGGGNITINGGEINATSNGGCAIGAAGGGTGKNIVINDGTVTATNNGNDAGAAIGGGNQGSCENIVINGGTVKATCSGGGAGIGASWNSSAKDIYINGGYVEASCTSKNLPGIGAANFSGNSNFKVATDLPIKAGSGPNPTTTIANNGNSLHTVLSPDGNYANVAYVVIGPKLAPHSHSWSYELSTTINTDDTIIAKCNSTTGICVFDGNKSLTIVKPAKTAADDTNSAKATFKDNKTSIAGAESTPKITYYTKTGGTEKAPDWGDASETAPTKAGTYKACFTVGGQTASVVYTIVSSVSEITKVTYLSPIYNDDTKGASSGLKRWQEVELNLNNNGQHIDVKSDTKTWSSNNKVYVVSGTVTIDDTVTVSGDIKLLLRDDSHLTVKKGIKVSGDDNKLTIFVESSKKNGKLTVTSSGDNNAAIGGIGNDNTSGGNITINGGEINATANNGCAIGAAGQGFGKNIVINDGTVTAMNNGNSNGAAIGGGQGGGCENIVINGGAVKATCSNGAAGIGASWNSSAKNIYINGGYVEASSTGFMGIGAANGLSNFFVSQDLPIRAGASSGSATTIANDGNSLHAAIFPINNQWSTMAYVEIGTKPVTHSHSWSYALNAAGDTITATCSGSGNCDFEGNISLTIVKPAKTTYGDANSASATFKDSKTSIAGNDGTPKITYYTKTGGTDADPTWSGTASETAPANAGTYKACFTVGTKTAYVKYTIAKADITPVVSINGWTYGATANAPSVTSGNPGNGTVSYAYKGKTASDSTYSTTVPSDAGEYTVKATVPETTNYNGGSATKDFTIAQKAITVAAGTFKVSKVYDGTVAAGTASGALSVTDIIPKDQSSVSIKTGSFPSYDAKDVKSDYSLSISISISGDTNGNYKIKDGITSISVPGEITAKTVTVTAEDKSMTVDGSVPELTYTVSGFVGSDTFTSLPTVSCDADGKKEGTFDIVVSGGTVGSNYTLEYVKGTLIVGKSDNKDGINYIAIADIRHGKISVTPQYASKDEIVTINVAPDKGYKLQTVTAADFKGKKLDLKKTGINTYTFKMPNNHVKISATFMEANSFVDVKSGDYFCEPVQWASEKGIASGVDETHFAPNAITTRGQAVAFLWRAAGSPEPTIKNCGFVDVHSSDYYYKAVLWAVEKGIVKGTGANVFSPNVGATRGQVMTFLARMNGVKDVDNVYNHSFVDVNKADYCSNAIAWAAANKIASGTTATIFAPNSTCLRGQIITFIYRCYNK